MRDLKSQMEWNPAVAGTAINDFCKLCLARAPQPQPSVAIFFFYNSLLKKKKTNYTDYFLKVKSFSFRILIVGLKFFLKLYSPNRTLERSAVSVGDVS